MPFKLYIFEKHVFPNRTLFRNAESALFTRINQIRSTLPQFRKDNIFLSRSYSNSSTFVHTQTSKADFSTQSNFLKSELSESTDTDNQISQNHHDESITKFFEQIHIIRKELAIINNRLEINKPTRASKTKSLDNLKGKEKSVKKPKSEKIVKSNDSKKSKAESTKAKSKSKIQDKNTISKILKPKETSQKAKKLTKKVEKNHLMKLRIVKNPKSQKNDDSNIKKRYQ
ncbi:hypothetical protein BB560_004163 [Smittium megazygosporum]|uniref:Uncharacterized protein n=1 Tax=Smittium megazygosporum TaxID=133381 RepID=A0A2T9ZA14_9FUNG|nr:hypothetical protein BB560_004163 [Smittium megazygosporum]